MLSSTFADETSSPPDRSTVENGCVCVVPKSHTTRLPHAKHPVQGNTLQDSEVANIAELTPLEMEPGDGRS